MRRRDPLRGLVLAAVLVAGCSDSGSDDEGGAQGSGAGAGAGAATGNGSGTGSGTGGSGSTGSGSGSAGSSSGTASGAAGEAGSNTGSAGSGDTAGSGASGGGSGAGASGRACGSRGLGPCDAGELCSFPEGASCGEADRPGTCEAIPSGCTKVLAPVCGCDGMDYPNRCNALAAGVSVRRDGECDAAGGSSGGAGSSGGEPSGETCGGFAGLACPDGEYCDLALGQGCDVADGTGECAVQPGICTFEYNPVCGCDGETYGTACAAAAAGVSVDHMGEC